MAFVILLWALVGLLQISNSRAEFEKPVLNVNPCKNFSLCDDTAAENIYQQMDLLFAANEILRVKLDALNIENKLHFMELKGISDGSAIPPKKNCTETLEKIKKGGQGVVSECNCDSAGKSPPVKSVTPHATLPSNCDEALQRTTAPKDGPQLIQIPNSKLPPFYVYCKLDPKQSGGPWTIIQRRKDGSIDFYRGWNEYKRGFGNLEGEFFLGLDLIHALTHSALHELWIFMETDIGYGWAKYSTFAIADESNGYALNMLGSFSGGAGDSLTYHAGQKFSTYDKDNDRLNTRNCAEEYKGGWWYKDCHYSNLNGLYLNGTMPKEKESQGIVWANFRGHLYSYQYVHMAIRPVAHPAI